LSPTLVGHFVPVLYDEFTHPNITETNVLTTTETCLHQRYFCKKKIQKNESVKTTKKYDFLFYLLFSSLNNFIREDKLYTYYHPIINYYI